MPNWVDNSKRGKNSKSHSKRHIPDIYGVPSSFTTVIKLFSSKCKYCNKFQIFSKHLQSRHGIRIETFTVESVYSQWKNSKKHIKNRTKTSWNLEEKLWFKSASTNSLLISTITGNYKSNQNLNFYKLKFKDIKKEAVSTRNYNA